MFSTQSVTQIVIWITFKMSSANAFKLEWSQILLFGKELTLFYTVPTFNDPEKKQPFENIVGVTIIFSFSYNVFYLSQNKF